MKTNTLEFKEMEKRFKFNSPSQFAKIVSSMIKYDKSKGCKVDERFIFAGLSLDYKPVCIGNIMFGKMEIKDLNSVFAGSILRNAKYGVIIQYVKDKVTEISDRDIKNTLELMTSNSIIQIIDHIIVWKGGYLSFEKKGIMEELQNSVEEGKEYIKRQALEKYLSKVKDKKTSKKRVKKI